jgi:hypothetical protein
MHIQINNSIRIVFAFVFGIGAAVFVWYLIGQSHHSFTQLGFLGLVPPIASGVIGGAITSTIAPNRKAIYATMAGLILVLPLLAFLLRNGFSHFGRNPFFWYWPIWLLPSFAVGGFLAQSKQKNA